MNKWKNYDQMQPKLFRTLAWTDWLSTKLLNSQTKKIDCKELLYFFHCFLICILSKVCIVFAKIIFPCLTPFHYVIIWIRRHRNKENSRFTRLRRKIYVQSLENEILVMEKRRNQLRTDIQSYHKMISNSVSEKKNTNITPWILKNTVGQCPISK